MTTWGWQKEDWPNFSYDPSILTHLEEEFKKSTYVSYGALRHLDAADRL